MAIKVKIWSALHTGETKFYHVVRFIATAHGRGASFAIEHNGPRNLYTGLGKVATGQCRVDSVVDHANVGVDKIRQKTKEGYTLGAEEVEHNFSTVSELKRWLHDSFNVKAKGLAIAEINKPQFNGLAEAMPPPSAAAPLWDGPEKVNPPEEIPGHLRHEEWGSW